VLPAILSRGTHLSLAALGARLEHHEVNGWRLPAHRLGPRGAEPWVLLHGMGATAATWLPLLPRLRRDCELLLPELSELGGARGPAPVLLPRNGAAAIVELLSRLFPDRPVTLAGTSLGGWIAVQAALAAPERIGRLVLVNPGGFRDQDWQAVARAVEVESSADAQRFLSALFARPPLLFSLAAPLLKRLHHSPAVAHLLGALSAEDAFGAAELARLPMPTALIWGEEDGIFRVEAGEAMARAMPHARLYRIAAAGHAVHWERRREVAAAVADFRARHPAA